MGVKSTTQVCKSARVWSRVRLNSGFSFPVRLRLRLWIEKCLYFKLNVFGSHLAFLLGLTMFIFFSWGRLF